MPVRGYLCEGLLQARPKVIVQELEMLLEVGYGFEFARVAWLGRIGDHQCGKWTDEEFIHCRRRAEPVGLVRWPIVDEHLCVGTAGIEHDCIVDKRNDTRSIDDGQVRGDDDSEQEESRGDALQEIDDRTGMVGLGRLLVLLLLAHRSC